MNTRSPLLLISLFVLLNQTANSQNVGINSTGSAPGSSAMLDVSSTSKGMLIPRVSLVSTTDVATIPSPATSLLVYNSNASMTNGSVGYWYYDGSAWVKFELSNKNWSILGNSGTTASTAAIGSAVNNNFIGTTDSKNFIMATNNLERMRISSAGNIGINTIAPAQKLELSNGHVLLSNTNNTSDELRFQEPSTSGTSYTAFKAQAQSGNITYTLPASQSANTVLTNDGNGLLTWATSGSYLYKRKLADESVTSSTALQDDNDFSFTVAANQTYEITALIKASCNSTGRLKSQFVAPAGTTILINIFDNSSGLDDLDWYTAPSTTTTVGTYGIDASADMVVLQGTVVVGGTGGTFKMQWAQNTSNATATTLYTNSYMKLVRVE